MLALHDTVHRADDPRIGRSSAFDLTLQKRDGGKDIFEHERKVAAVQFGDDIARIAGRLQPFQDLVHADKAAARRAGIQLLSVRAGAGVIARMPPVDGAVFHVQCHDPVPEQIKGFELVLVEDDEVACVPIVPFVLIYPTPSKSSLINR